MRISNRLLLATASLAAIAVPAGAQSLPDAKIAVVDGERVMRDCTACVAANTQLQQQLQAIQQRAQAAGTPLQTEATSLEAAIRAANNQPNAALQQRIQAFQTRQQTAQRTVQQEEQTFQRNVQYVRQQIGQRMIPIVQQIAQQRGATIAVDKGNTIYNAGNVDITAPVLAQLNTALPSVNVVAPPPAAAPAAGAAPAPVTPAPRPTGR